MAHGRFSIGLMLVSVLIISVAQGKENISVLPLVSDALKENMRAVVIDDFRRYLEETGAFAVMSREMMEEILEEQEFRMSDACDRASCMVEVGKVIGVSRIVSVIATRERWKTYTVAAKMVDVRTGHIVGNASETRRGRKHDVIRRMMKNVAGVLAGKPGEDHRTLLLKEDRFERITMKNVRVSLAGIVGWRQQFFTDDPDGRYRAYYEGNPTMMSWGMPENESALGVGLGASLRLGEKVWIKTRLSYARERERRYMGEWTDTTNLDDTWYHYQTSRNRSHILDVSAGMDFVLLHGPYFSLSVSVMPAIGYGRVLHTGTDSTRLDCRTFIEGEYWGQTVILGRERWETRVDGIVGGADLSVNTSWHITDRWSLDLCLGIKSLIAPSLDGETNGEVRSITYSRVHAGGVVEDSTYSERAAAIKGDFLGTGEYVSIRNPDEKVHTPDNTLVRMEKHYYELSRIRMNLGVSYSF